MSEPPAVVFHFPGPIGADEQRHYQLSHALSRHRRVFYVCDGPSRSSDFYAITHDRNLGIVEILRQERSRNYARLERRAPVVARALVRSALLRAMRARDALPCVVFTFGVHKAWTFSSKHIARVIELNDPPFDDFDRFWEEAKKPLAQAHAVTATARALIDRVTPIRGDAMYLPNAGNGPAPCGRSGSSVLYVGTIDWRFDFELVEELARRLPQRTFVIVGRVIRELEERY